MTEWFVTSSNWTSLLSTHEYVHFFRFNWDKDNVISAVIGFYNCLSENTARFPAVFDLKVN